MTEIVVGRTHIRRSGGRRPPPTVYAPLEQADLVVVGHSHILVDDSTASGVQPSPTERRSQPVHTLGRLRIADGTARHKIVVV